MEKIRLLDDVTINKIAAGEVIDRPASALKELLENSADGGATKIDVQFEEGGRSLLRVIDDGEGISSKELPLALQRHATSKIKTIDDVFNLNSFGFRGEALASMGAVSELTLSSTLKGSPKGAAITATGGKLSPISPAPPLEGTQVEVKNLFFNVPARQKFLKSVGGETAAIKKTFKSFAAIHPEIQLSLKQDGRQILLYPKTTFLKRACDILGVPASDCFELTVDKGFKLHAVLVHPKNNLSTQGGVFIFVQNRFVQDKLIQQAVMEGYRNLVMEHQFPQAIISLEVPTEFVDVNVHPAKLQVKFQNPSEVFRFVSSEIKNLFAEKLENKINPSQELFSTRAERPYSSPGYQPELIRDAVVQYNQKSFESVAPLALSLPDGTDSEMKPVPTFVESSKPATWTALQVIGQLANTYILTQSNKGLVLIDQHAAHERVLFERLKSREIATQPALFEELIELSPEQVETLMQDQWQTELKKLGLEFHQRGPHTLALTTRPTFLADAGLKPLIERLAEQIVDAGSTASVTDLITDVWASMSCHGAIRAGKVLSQSEMQSLLVQMEEASFSSFCPHGRPVSVQISLVDLEKLFKRIV